MNQTRAIDQTVAALRLVREKWGALLAAVEAPSTAADWPPRRRPRSSTRSPRGRCSSRTGSRTPCARTPPR